VHGPRGRDRPALGTGAPARRSSRSASLATRFSWRPDGAARPVRIASSERRADVHEGEECHCRAKFLFNHELKGTSTATPMAEQGGQCARAAEPPPGPVPRMQLDSRGWATREGRGFPIVVALLTQRSDPFLGRVAAGVDSNAHANRAGMRKLESWREESCALEHPRRVRNCRGNASRSALAEVRRHAR